MNAAQIEAVKRLRETVRECLAIGIGRTMVRSEVSLALAETSTTGRSDRFSETTPVKVSRE